MTEDELNAVAEETASKIAAIVEHQPFADVESHAVESIILAALQRVQRAQMQADAASIRALEASLLTQAQALMGGKEEEVPLSMALGACAFKLSTLASTIEAARPGVEEAPRDGE